MLHINLAIWKFKVVKQLIPNVEEETFVLTPDDSFLWKDPNQCNTQPLLLALLAPVVWTYLKNKSGQGNLVPYFSGVCCYPSRLIPPQHVPTAALPSLLCSVLPHTHRCHILGIWALILGSIVRMGYFCEVIVSLHLPLLCFIPNYAKPKWEKGCYLKALQKPKHQSLFIYFNSTVLHRHICLSLWSK